MRFVIVGGGVAAICCAEELCRYRPDDAVVLVSAHRVLKGVRTVTRLTRHAEELQVEEKDVGALPYKNLSWVQGEAVGIDSAAQHLLLADGKELAYDKLCVCTGARPKTLGVDSPHVLTLRDTESVEALRARLPGARRVMVVGNGGIALELIHALRGIEVVWAVRHGHIGDAFFDLDAAQFLLEELQQERAQPPAPQGAAASQAGACAAHEQRSGNAASNAALDEGSGQAAFTATRSGRQGMLGHAVGPAWATALPSRRDAAPSHVTLEYGCEVAGIQAAAPPSSTSHPNDSWPVTVSLTNGHVHQADFVVAAVGVTPAVEWVPLEVRRAADGGLEVDNSMETSLAGVHAAGDACSPTWALQASPHWFQMRLWSQARASGVYTAHCMAGVQHDTGSDMAFELFTHVTRFLGKKVVLLGLYNGQRLEHESADDIVTYSRVGEAEHGGGGCCGRGSAPAPGSSLGRTFVRVLLLRGRVQGAVLIGETGLEETFENLILDGLDVGQYGPYLLDPDAELDHVFD